MASIESFCKQFEKAIVLAVENEVSDKMIKTVEEHVQSDVYDAYQSQSNHPDRYQRTGALINSLQKEVNSSGAGDIEIIINHDSNKMNYWSVTGQSVDQQGIPRMIEDGTIHPLFGGGFSYLQPRPYMSNAEHEILKNLEKMLVSAIVKRLK